MLCSLLKIWNTYTIANALFPGYGKMYSTPSDEPVAMTMAYRHREVTIVNHKEYMKCFTTEVADKFNAAVLTIAPDMYKFTTSLDKAVLDHYIFYDKNANIKMPVKVEESKMEKTLTKTIERFISNKKRDTHSLSRNIIAKNVGSSIHTTEKKIEDIVNRIVRKEYKLSRSESGKNGTMINDEAHDLLRKTLKTSIKNLVKTVIKAHRATIIVNTKVDNVLSITKKKESPAKKAETIKKILKSVLKMNAIRSVTPKKIGNIMTIVRSYSPLIAQKKIKSVVQSIIRTHTNRALSKHTIGKMVAYVRSNSGKLSDQKIESTIKRMMTTIINTTVNTIIPKGRVAEIISLSKKSTPKDFAKTVKTMIHDIRVDDDKEDITSKCPVCKCNFRRFPKNAKKAKRRLSKKVKKVKKVKRVKRLSKQAKRAKLLKQELDFVRKAMEIKPTPVALVPVSRSSIVTVKKAAKKVEKVVVKASTKVVKVVVKVAKKAPNVLKVAKKAAKVEKVMKVAKKAATVVKKVIVVSQKKKALSKKLKNVKKTVARLKKINAIIKKKINNVKNALRVVESRDRFNELVSKMKTLNKKQTVLKKKVATLNVVKFRSNQKLFNLSKKGARALNVCHRLGATGSVLNGCMQDMRLTKKPSVVVKAVQQTIATLNALKKANRFQAKTGIAPSRTCSAVGDPHFTNFNGDYFHIQQPAIYTFAKTSDGLFEVQVKQDGARGVGDPSYVRDVMIRYDGKIYHNNFNKNGFIVRGGNTAVSVTVPGSYQGEMTGICGDANPKSSPSNFRLPSGAIADVNYGKPNWQIGGYGGPFTKLSKWHLSWRPSLSQCMFSQSDCRKNIQSQLTNSRNRYVNTPFGRVDTLA